MTGPPLGAVSGRTRSASIESQRATSALNGPLSVRICTPGTSRSHAGKPSYATDRGGGGAKPFCATWLIRLPSPTAPRRPTPYGGRDYLGSDEHTGRRHDGQSMGAKIGEPSGSVNRALATEEHAQRARRP